MYIFENRRGSHLISNIVWERVDARDRGYSGGFSSGYRGLDRRMRVERIQVELKSI